MAKYKVLNAFDMGGVTQEPGTVLELSVEQVDNFGIANLEVVSDDLGSTSGAVSGGSSTSGSTTAPVTSKFKVLVETDGLDAEVDSIVDLTPEQAEKFASSVEAVQE
jgi:hypothetical protein